MIWFRIGGFGLGFVFRDEMRGFPPVYRTLRKPQGRRFLATKESCIKLHTICNGKPIQHAAISPLRCAKAQRAGKGDSNEQRGHHERKRAERRRLPLGCELLAAANADENDDHRYSDKAEISQRSGAAARKLRRESPDHHPREHREQEHQSDSRGDLRRRNGEDELLRQQMVVSGKDDRHRHGAKKARNGVQREREGRIPAREKSVEICDVPYRARGNEENSHAQMRRERQNVRNLLFMKNAAMFATITVTLAGASLAQTAKNTLPEKAVEANDRAYEAAYARADANALADFFADNAQYIADDGRTFTSRAEIEAAIRSGLAAN